MVAPTPEANPLANMKQELALNHSMIMDQLNRIVRELNKLKPSMEELGQSVSRQADRLKDELTDEMVRVTGGLSELEKDLREGLDQRFQELRKEVLGNLEDEAKKQQETLNQLATKVESFSRQTTASLSQLRMALSMAEIEAEMRQRNPDARTVDRKTRKPPKASRTGASISREATPGESLKKATGKEGKEIKETMEAKEAKEAKATKASRDGDPDSGAPSPAPSEPTSGSPSPTNSSSTSDPDATANSNPDATPAPSDGSGSASGRTEGQTDQESRPGD